VDCGKLFQDIAGESKVYCDLENWGHLKLRAVKMAVIAAARASWEEDIGTKFWTCSAPWVAELGKESAY
jgi:hypothetical protein